jgi:hypothetical protein
MADYTRAEARDWAREKLIGAVNCTIPSFTGDLKAINEAAIRYDVRLAKSHGFIGTLGVSEVSITLPEYLEFLAICKDEAGPGCYVVHPSDIPARLIRRLIDDIPNLAVIKAEGGAPSIMGAIECHRLFGQEVVISVPIEGDLIPLSQLMPIQLSATSDHEYYGPMIPRVMGLLRDGKYAEATEIYWQLHPARKAKGALAPSMHGGFFLNRQAWKFQGWL